MTNPSISNKKKLTPSQKKKQAALLAKSSISDIFDFLSHNTQEELNADEEYDIESVLKNPKNFKKNSYNQQQSIIQHLDDEYKLSDWKNMPLDVKRGYYFISYGNWGPRKSFKDPIMKNYFPEDSPFTFKSSPTIRRKVKKLPKINLMLVTPEREKIFNDSVKKLDPMSQLVVIFVILVTIGAVIQDKFHSDNKDKKEEVLEDLKLLELVEKNKLEDEQKKKQETLLIPETQEKKSEPKQNNRWYYLWLY